MNEIMLEMAIGRQLTEVEKESMEQVNRWDRRAASTLMSLMLAARDAGFRAALKSR